MRPKAALSSCVCVSADKKLRDESDANVRVELLYCVLLRSPTYGADFKSEILSAEEAGTGTTVPI
jgi:hypothetical protein